MCLGLTILMMAPLLYVVNRVSPFYEHHGKSNKLGLGKLNNCFWYLYGALLQQGEIELMF